MQATVGCGAHGTPSPIETVSVVWIHLSLSTHAVTSATQHGIIPQNLAPTLRHVNRAPKDNTSAFFIFLDLPHEGRRHQGFCQSTGLVESGIGAALQPLKEKAITNAYRYTGARRRFHITGQKQKVSDRQLPHRHQQRGVILGLRVDEQSLRSTSHNERPVTTKSYSAQYKDVYGKPETEKS